MRARVLSTVFRRYASGQPPAEVVVRYSDLIVTTQQPFRAGRSAVGAALASQEWQFALDCCLLVPEPWGITSPT